MAVLSIGQVWATDVTYTFTSKSWADASSAWTGGGDGNGFTNGQGIQVTTGTTGANATSNSSFSNVSKVVVTYNTNKSKGAGSIAIKIGTNDEVSNSVAYSGSADGTSANFTTQFDFSPVQTGAIKITTNTTTNSIWVKSITITYSNGGTPDPTVSADPEEVKDVDAAGVTNQTIDLTYENIENYETEVSVHPNADGTGTLDPAWLTASVSDADNYATVTYSVAANDGAARTAYIKVYTTDGDKEAETIIPVSQVKYSAPTGTFELFSGDLAEGDYVITHASANAIKAEINSDRFAAIEVSPSANIITNPDESIVWHIAQSGEYWTIYNVAADKYAASTGAKNKGALLDDGTDDKALWSLSGTYDFINKQNTANSVNATLRYNNQNALNTSWACYASGTGSALVLYKKQVAGQPATPTFSVAGGNYESAQSVEISCETVGAKIYYTLDGSKPSSTSTEYSTAIPVSATTTIKAVAIKDDIESTVASATYTIVVWQTVADVWDDITSSGPTNAHIYGYVSQTNVGGYANNFYISDNGSTEGNQLYAYRMDMNSYSVEKGDKVKLAGDLTLYNDVKEFKYTSADNCGKVIALEAKGDLQSVAVSGTPTKTEYAANETFDPTGLKVYGTYANGFMTEITEGIIWDNDLSEGKVTASTTVHVTATVSGITNDPAYDVPVTVTAKTLSSIALSADAFEVYQGQALPKPTVTATYSEGEPADVTTEATFEGYDAATLGAQTITVSYTFGGDTEEETYTVTVKSVENDEVHPYTVAQAIAIVDGGATIADKTVYVKGFVTAKTSTKITLKDNPSDADLIEMYQYTFDTDVESVVVNDMIIGSGTLSLWNSTKQLASGCKVEWVKPVATIAIANMSLEYEEEATLAPTITPAAAASTVSYAITGGDDCITLDNVNKKVTAKSVAGTATITATIAATEDYLGTTKEFTVTVSAPDSRKQAKDEDGFDEISGTLNSDISYASYKGGGTANPNVKDNAIQLYQISGTNANGGYITFTAAQGCKIDQVKITTAKNATHIAYAADGGDLSATTSNVSAGSIYLTDDNLDAQNVSIYCMHNSSDNRLFVATAVVYYTGTPVAVESIALSGTYPTVFGQGDAFSHEGMTVTATYTNSTSADVTGAAEFTGYDMDVVGPQTVTVSYGGQSTTYDIVVNAATVVDLALSGTYPTRFNVNDAFSHDGMTVTATYSNTSEVDVTADATFSGYNMSVGGVQTVTVSYGGESATYSIIVTPANTDVMVASNLEATSTQYKPFSGVTGLGTSAVYAGTNAMSTAGAIQLRTSDSESGIVVTAANGEKIVKSVSIAYQTAPTNERKLQVYGKHTTYGSAANLYSSEATVQGTLIGEIAADGSLDCTSTEEYEYIGLRSSDGAIYVAVIMIEWADPTPTTYAVTYASDHGSAPAATNAAAVTLEELTADGWTHNGWVANVDVEVNSATVTAGTLIDNGTEVVLSAATEFTAQWTENPPVGPDYTEVRTGLTEGWYYTMCLDKAVTAVKAGSIWRVLSKAANGSDVILEEAELPLVAGRPYIFRAAASTLEVAYTGDAVGAPVNDAANNGLIGSFEQVKIAEAATNYIIYNNALYFVNSNNVYVGAHRAYLDMNDVPAYSNEPQQGAPRRRVVMTVHGEQTATGCENINASETPVKMIIDGQLFIIRGEKMYDATGKLVK